MALLDFLKNKEESEKAKKSVKKTEPKKAAKVSAEKKEVKIEAPKASSVKNSGDFAYEAVKNPHISEKASYLSEKDQYVFEVSSRHNKTEVKKAIEGIYGVNVLSVNIINVPSKKRRVGRTEGFKKGYKKAVVKIKEGQKIEIL